MDKFFTCVAIIFSFLSTYVAGNLVPAVCKDLSKIDKQNINYDYCVSKLDSDPKSAHSFAAQLGEISFRLTTSKAEEVLSTIQNVVNQTRTDQLLIYPLRVCADVYSRVPNDFKDGLVELKAGNYNKANVIVSAAVKITSICGDVIKAGSGSLNVIKEKIDDFYKLGAISVGFTKLLRIIN